MGYFEKIAGYDRIKDQLRQLKDIMLNIEDYQKIGIRAPRGLLLYGKPGVGKTVLAKSIADNNIHLIELKAEYCTKSDGEKYIKSAFAEAAENMPSVLLIDDLDKIAETSSIYYIQDNDRTMKILLQELDNIKDSNGVLVVATCNSYEMLHSALIRSGRFDRLIEVRPPEGEDRKKILQHYLDRIQIAKDVDLDSLSRITSGYTGAQLECMINEAAIITIEMNANVISQSTIQKAINRILFKDLEGDVGDEEERTIIATHEAGHALVALYLIPDQLNEATIVPQGNTGGHVSFEREDVKIQETSEISIRNNISVYLAGIAAERIFLKCNYSSSRYDIKEAVNKAEQLLIGMGLKGYAVIMPDKKRLESENVPEYVLKKKAKFRNKVLKQQQRIASKILKKHKDEFLAIRKQLIDNLIVTRDEMFRIKDSAANTPKQKYGD